MTEAEIMKALEWCELFTDNLVLSSKKGEKFTFALQSLQTIEQVLKDYNRKNAEIERLQSMNQAKLDMIHDLREEIETARAEAIKEFIERLKAYPVRFHIEHDHLDKFVPFIDDNDLDQIAKEMGVEV